MSDDRMPVQPPLRLRELRAIEDSEGRCRLVYDLERTMVFEIPEDLSEKAGEALRGGRPDQEMSRWLLEEGLLTDRSRISWKEGASSVLPQITDVSLDLSGACNMGCVYCFENDIGSRTGSMSERTAMESLDFVFRKTEGSPRIVLHFGSGEPLLRFELLRRIVEEAGRRAEGTGQEISYELTTNASLVTAEMSDYLSRHPFNVRVSCDGPAHLHNRYRPLRNGRDSYAAVERGLGLLLSAMGDRLTVNSVISGGTRLSQVWSWAKAKGIRRYHVIKVGAYEEQDINLRRTELEDFRSDLESICNDLFEDLEQGRTPIDYQPITKVVRRLMIPQPITRFCGVAGSYLGVSSKGGVYPCFRHLGIKDYDLGDVTKGVDDEKRRSFLANEAAEVDSRPVCRECWARYLCGGGCYADSTVYGPDKRKPQVQHCPFWRAEIEQAIRFYKRLLNRSPYFCLQLFGDDPDEVMESLQDSRFLQRVNCS